MGRDERFTSLTPAVEQAAEILRYLASEPGLKAGLAHISRAVEINKSKTHVILDALHKSGFVQKEPTTKVYSLGFGLIPIGLTALRNANYKNAVRPILIELARETRCSALFGLVLGDDFVITDKEQSGEMMESRFRPGDTYPAYYGAHGRALLAGLDGRERRRLFETKYAPALDEGQKPAYEEFRAQVSECREKGFASFTLRTNDGHVVTVLAAAVFDADQRPFGCIMIVGFIPDAEREASGARAAESAKKLMYLLGSFQPLRVAARNPVGG